MGRLRAGAVCCVDPTASGDSGTRFAVSACDAMAAGGGLGAGELLSIGVVSGAVVGNATMTGTPHHLRRARAQPRRGRVRRRAVRAATEFGLFSFDASGAVAQPAAFPKQTMDDLADCVGGVLSTTGEVFWQFAAADAAGDALVFWDVAARAETRRVAGFFAPVVEDAARPGSLLALANRPLRRRGGRVARAHRRRGRAGLQPATTSARRRRARAGPGVARGRRRRRRVWFAASYNNASSGELCRGRVSTSKATTLLLVSEAAS